MTRRPNGVARVGVDPEVAQYRAAVVTGIRAMQTDAIIRDLARITPDALTSSLSTDPPMVLILIPREWPARVVLSAVAESRDVSVVLLNRPITPDDVHVASTELTDAAEVAGRVCPSGSVVEVDDLLPYRCLVSAPLPELELLISQTLGAVLGAPRAERQRLLETLWARHRNDTESATVRALGIDPRTLRRRRERIRELTGLDPSRQVDRFRLDLGLHALTVLENAHATTRIGDVHRPYPRESHEPGVCPNFVIAPQRDPTSSSAPHPPRTTADRAGGEEQTC